MLCIHAVIVKASSGPRYVVGCRNKVDKAKLKAGTRVALDMTTLTIMRALPREVNLLELVVALENMLCLISAALLYDAACGSSCQHVSHTAG